MIEPEDYGKLIDGCLAGSKEHLRTLVTNFSDLVYALVRRHYGGSQEDVQDLFQEVFIQLTDRNCLRRINDPTRLKSWVYAITLRRCIDRIRYKKRRGETVDYPIENISADAKYAPDELADQEMRGVILRNALQDLNDPRCKAIIEAKFFADLSHPEISSALGMPVGSIGPTLGRNFKKLLRILRRKGISPSD